MMRLDLGLIPAPYLGSEDERTVEEFLEAMHSFFEFSGDGSSSDEYKIAVVRNNLRNQALDCFRLWEKENYRRPRSYQNLEHTLLKILQFQEKRLSWERELRQFSNFSPSQDTTWWFYGYMRVLARQTQTPTERQYYQLLKLLPVRVREWIDTLVDIRREARTPLKALAYAFEHFSDEEGNWFVEDRRRSSHLEEKLHGMAAEGSKARELHAQRPNHFDEPVVTYRGGFQDPYERRDDPTSRAQSASAELESRHTRHGSGYSRTMAESHLGPNPVSEEVGGQRNRYKDPYHEVHEKDGYRGQGLHDSSPKKWDREPEPLDRIERRSTQVEYFDEHGRSYEDNYGSWHGSRVPPWKEERGEENPYISRDRDLVSGRDGRIYRHSTGERVWFTEQEGRHSVDAGELRQERMPRGDRYSRSTGSAENKKRYFDAGEEFQRSNERNTLREGSLDRDRPYEVVTFIDPDTPRSRESLDIDRDRGPPTGREIADLDRDPPIQQEIVDIDRDRKQHSENDKREHADVESGKIEKARERQRRGEFMDIERDHEGQRERGMVDRERTRSGFMDVELERGRVPEEMEIFHDRERRREIMDVGQKRKKQPTQYDVELESDLRREKTGIEQERQRKRSPTDIDSERETQVKQFDVDRRQEMRREIVEENERERNLESAGASPERENNEQIEANRNHERHDESAHSDHHLQRHRNFVEAGHKHEGHPELPEVTSDPREQDGSEDGERDMQELNGVGHGQKEAYNHSRTAGKKPAPRAVPKGSYEERNYVSGSSGPAQKPQNWQKPGGERAPEKNRGLSGRKVAEERREVKQAITSPLHAEDEPELTQQEVSGSRFRAEDRDSWFNDVHIDLSRAKTKPSGSSVAEAEKPTSYEKRAFTDKESNLSSQRQVGGVLADRRDLSETTRTVQKGNVTAGDWSKSERRSREGKVEHRSAQDQPPIEREASNGPNDWGSKKTSARVQQDVPVDELDDPLDAHASAESGHFEEAPSRSPSKPEKRGVSQIDRSPAKTRIEDEISQPSDRTDVIPTENRSSRPRFEPDSTYRKMEGSDGEIDEDFTPSKKLEPSVGHGKRIARETTNEKRQQYSEEPHHGLDDDSPRNAYGVSMTEDTDKEADGDGSTPNLRSAGPPVATSAKQLNPPDSAEPAPSRGEIELFEDPDDGERKSPYDVVKPPQPTYAASSFADTVKPPQPTYTVTPFADDDDLDFQPDTDPRQEAESFRVSATDGRTNGGNGRLEHENSLDEDDAIHIVGRAASPTGGTVEIIGENPAEVDSDNPTAGWEDSFAHFGARPPQGGESVSTSSGEEGRKRKVKIRIPKRKTRPMLKRGSFKRKPSGVHRSSLR